MIGATLQGAQGAQRSLARLAAAADGQIMTPAISGGASVLVEKIKARAPYKTGYLRSRIYFKPKAGNASTTLSVAAPKSHGFIVVDCYYARFIEYGTSRMPAHPFVRPVEDDSNDDYRWKVGLLAGAAILALLTGGTATVVEGAAVGVVEAAAESAVETGIIEVAEAFLSSTFVQQFALAA